MQVRTIRIGQRTIGERHPTFIVAEIGVNHDGKAGKACQMIRAAARCGADAVKFQMFSTQRLVGPETETAPYQRQKPGGKTAQQTQKDLLAPLELSLKDLGKIQDACTKAKVVFMASCFDPESLKTYLGFHPQIIKVGSGELTDIPLLEQIARAKLPVFLSTGMAAVDEIRDAVQIFHKRGGTGHLCLLHCVSRYPTPLEDANVRAVPTLAETFRLPVGYSDHTTGTAAAMGAVALGACVIEKHFTLDNGAEGPDHAASADPETFQAMVSQIRALEQALGTGDKAPGRLEKDHRPFLRKSVVAACDIPKGSIISEDMLTIKRPGTGIPPRFLRSVPGLRTTKAIAKDEPIQWTQMDL